MTNQRIESGCAHGSTHARAGDGVGRGWHGLRSLGLRGCAGRQKVEVVFRRPALVIARTAYRLNIERAAVIPMLPAVGGLTAIDADERVCARHLAGANAGVDGAEREDAPAPDLPVVAAREAILRPAVPMRYICYTATLAKTHHLLSPRLLVANAAHRVLVGRGLRHHAIGLSLQLVLGELFDLELTPPRRVLAPPGDRRLSNAESTSQGGLTAVKVDRIFLSHATFYRPGYCEGKR